MSNQGLMEKQITTEVDNKLGQLKAILYLLQTNLEEFKDEVDRSYELIKIGEMTDLSKKLETTLSNPLSNIFEISKNIDTEVKYIVDKFVKSFLRSNKGVVSSAYRSKTSMNDLHYSIVLSDDNMANRNKIFDFFDRYDLLDIASKYPVYFQFVPAELVEKVTYSEVVNLD